MDAGRDTSGREARMDMQSVRIECLASGPDRAAVEELIGQVAELAGLIDGVDVRTEAVSTQPGIFESLFTSGVSLYIVAPIVAGLATNALWAWITSRRGAVTADAKAPGAPVKVNIDGVILVIVISSPDEPAKTRPAVVD